MQNFIIHFIKKNCNTIYSIAKEYLNKYTIEDNKIIYDSSVMQSISHVYQNKFEGIEIESFFNDNIYEKYEDKEQFLYFEKPFIIDNLLLSNDNNYLKFLIFNYILFNKFFILSDLSNKNFEDKFLKKIKDFYIELSKERYKDIFWYFKIPNSNYYIFPYSKLLFYYEPIISGNKQNNYNNGYIIKNNYNIYSKDQVNVIFKILLKFYSFKPFIGILKDLNDIINEFSEYIPILLLKQNKNSWGEEEKNKEE